MADRVIDTPQALDAAIEENKRVKREALVRTAKGEGVHVAEILSAMVVLLALIEVYVEPRRAVIGALIAIITSVSVYLSRSSRKQQAKRALRDLDIDK